MPGLAGQHLVARFDQESRSLDELVVVRQVSAKAGKLICRSGSGLVRVARLRHSPAGWSIMMGSV